MRMGVLGGTFDPPHFAHLLMAEQAREQLGLARLLWVPAADPPHKQDGIITPVAQRVAMLRLATEGNPFFEISLVDVERPGPHYSVDMVGHLLAQHPGAELFFIIGADSLADLPTWNRPQQLIARCVLAVVPRAGVSYDLAALEQYIPGLITRLVFVDSPVVELSSQMIRARTAAGLSIRYMVPSAVEAYIDEHRLYRPDRM